MSLTKWASRVWHSPGVTLIRKGTEAAAKQAVVDKIERAIRHTFGELLRMNDAEAICEKVAIELCEARQLLEAGKKDAYQARVERLANSIERARM